MPCTTEKQIDMARNKSGKLAETKEMANILEAPEHLRGQWAAHFANPAPLVLELACGHGYYTLALARRNPLGNYMGIDIKGARLWKGGKIALAENLHNVRFMRCRIEMINKYFAPSEVDEIWITFPDPQPKKDNNRLTHPFFLEKYRQMLKPGGVVHLKTDNTPLFEFTLGAIAGMGIKPGAMTRNLYKSKLYEDEMLQVSTHYEEMFVADGAQIKYLNFRL